MISGIFKEMKPFSQLMFTMFIIVACFLAFLLISMIVAIPLFGFDSIMKISEINDLNNPDNINILKYFQVVQSIGVFIVPPFILAWFFSSKKSGYLQLNKKITLSSALLVFILCFSASPLINFIGEMNAKMQLPGWLAGMEEWMKNAEEKATLLTEAFLKVDGIGGLFFNLFMIALLPAVGEELLFRGVIQKIFTNWTRNSHWGIWIAATLFSALHMQFFGFIPRLLLGVLFGYLLVWSGSMWLPILAHFINNGVAVIGMYLIDKGMIGNELEEIGTSGKTQFTALISLFLVLLVLWIIRRQYLNNEWKAEFINKETKN